MVMRIVWTAAAVILLLIICSMYLVHFAVWPKMTSWEKAHDTEERKGFLQDYDSLQKEEYTVQSFDGYELHCEYIPAERSYVQKIMIFTHGYSYNRLGAVKYMHVFRRRGFDCILYDDRGHGRNRKCRCSFGLDESRDLLAVIQDARNRFGSDVEIGLHGESMGASITAMVMKYHPPVQFAFCDCGYGSLPRELSYQLKKMFHIPEWMLRVIDILGRPVSRFSFYQVIPEDALKDNAVPVCFIHGDADRFVPCSESQSMAEKSKGYQKLHLVKGAGHAKSFQTDPEGYEQIMDGFLNHVEAGR